MGRWFRTWGLSSPFLGRSYYGNPGRPATTPHLVAGEMRSNSACQGASSSGCEDVVSEIQKHGGLLTGILGHGSARGSRSAYMRSGHNRLQLEQAREFSGEVSSDDQREVMNYDVVIVGWGPAGLGAAIRLKQLCQEKDRELSVCVVEKAPELGAHILSGNEYEPRALSELFPDWKEQDAPVKVPVTADKFWFLTEKHALPMPSPFNNDGNYVISLSQLVRWLGMKAEELGVEIHPGFAASEAGSLFLEKAIEVLYLRLSLRSSNYGSKHKRSTKPMLSELRREQVWEIEDSKYRPGYVLHTLGWPLDYKTYGGTFLYHMDDRQVAIGLVVALDYKNPYLSPYEEYQG